MDKSVSNMPAQTDNARRTDAFWPYVGAKYVWADNDHGGLLSAHIRGRPACQ
jgi:hypothetical protein